MSRIDSICDKLKEKSSLKKVEKYSLSSVNTSKPHLTKHTIYLTKDQSDKLDQIYATRILHGFKDNKYKIISEAIDLLFEKEKVKIK